MGISRITVSKMAAGLVLSFAVFQFGLTNASAAPVEKKSEPSAEQVRVMSAYGNLPLSF